MDVILVSGFEPFGGEKINPACEIAGELEGEVVGGARLHSVVLPVTWDGAVQTLIRAANDLTVSSAGPNHLLAVVMLGQAGGYAAPGLERVAVNASNGKDNADVERTEQPVVSGGPSAYFSSLPLRAIQTRLESLGLPSFISNSAGTYLCNCVFYGFMHHLAQAAAARTAGVAGPDAAAGPDRAQKVLAGFIHVPFLPEQAVGKRPPPPSMSRADIIRCIRTAIETTAEIAKAGGASDGDDRGGESGDPTGS